MPLCIQARPSSSHRPLRRFVQPRSPNPLKQGKLHSPHLFRPSHPSDRNHLTNLALGRAPDYAKPTSRPSSMTLKNLMTRARHSEATAACSSRVLARDRVRTRRGLETRTRISGSSSPPDHPTKAAVFVNIEMTNSYPLPSLNENAEKIYARREDG
jgi:hypothetical protein